MIRKRTLVLIPALLMVLLMTFPAQIQGADGETGEIKLDQDEIVDGSRIYARLKDLTAATDYLLNWTGDDTGMSWTCGAAETSKNIPLTVEKPATGMFSIYLRYQSAGTLIDSVSFVVSEPSEMVSEDQFVEIALVFIGFAILVAIVVGFTAGVAKKRK